MSRPLNYMTDIPGTGKLSEDFQEENISPDPQITNISAINIKEIKKIQSGLIKPEDEIWYNKLRFWVLFGFGASVIFLILAVIDIKFLILTPVFPIAAWISWYVRKLVRLYEGKSKGLLK